MEEEVRKVLKCGGRARGVEFVSGWHRFGKTAVSSKIGVSTLRETSTARHF